MIIFAMQMAHANEQQIEQNAFPGYAMQFFYRMSGNTNAVDCLDNGECESVKCSCTHL
jgi:hypothetical protein